VEPPNQVDILSHSAPSNTTNLRRIHIISSQPNDLNTWQ